MDDDRIRQLTQEVLAQVQAPGETGRDRSLEARVTALEAAVARLQPRAGGTTAEAAPEVAIHVHTTHPSLQLLQVEGGSTGGACLLEPDRPCVQSGCCRSHGH